MGRVTFKNDDNKPFLVELGPRTLFECVDKAFENEFDGYAKLALIDIFGEFNIQGKQFPYFRHTDISTGTHRFGNIVELGDGPFEVQKGTLHSGEVATKETPLNNYRKISDSPLCYGFDSDEPFVEYRAYENYATIKEGNFLNLKAELWPFTIYDHQSHHENASMIIQPCTWLGKIDDKPVIGVGSIDYLCLKENKKFDNINFGYISVSCIGIRDDGRKECAFFNGSLENKGQNMAFYICEGENPIFTNHFEMEAEWHHLPYVNDGTCCIKEAVFYFCGKELHFNGKWGTKGFTEKPRVEKHGQSQIYGTWYVGNKEYSHTMYWCMSENMEAYDYVLAKKGFTVID